MMATKTYTDKVIGLFKNGNPTKAMWAEMAAAVLASAGEDTALVERIEKAMGMSENRTADLAAWDGATPA
jgi:hypothetical protein